MYCGILVMAFLCVNIIYGMNNQDTRQVLGVGQAVNDIVVPAPTSQIEGYIKIGNLIKYDSKNINGEVAEKLRRSLAGPKTSLAGGSVSNTAAGLGNIASFIGVIGQDDAGEQFKNDMIRQKVHVYLPASPKKNSTTSQIFCFADQDRKGARTMAAHISPYSEISIENGLDIEIIKNMVKSHKVILTDAYTYFTGNSNSLLQEMFGFAKSNNVLNAFSLSSAALMQHRREDILANVLPHIDILFGNKQEYENLFQPAGGKDITMFISDMVLNDLYKKKIFVMTKGEQGSIIVSADRTEEFFAKSVDNIIDKTGAGDQYAAGFLFGYVCNLSLKKCGKLGTKCAAKIIQQIGGQPTQPFDCLKEKYTKQKRRPSKSKSKSFKQSLKNSKKYGNTN